MVECSQASKGCEWYLRAGKIKDSDFWSVIVHTNMHTCSPSEDSTSYIKQKGTPQLVASVLHEDYLGIFDTLTPKTIMGIVRGRLGLHCSYSTALRGKKQHVKNVRGSPETSYKNLEYYLHMLRMVNPGKITSVELDEEKRFKFLFIALGASIEGFRAMRKVIVVDATHLKTVYGGMLVFATAQDPNHHHYPIAFGVIDTENHISWPWFFNKLKTIVPDDPELVFISDRHKSIISVVSEVYPSARHAHCIYHLSKNPREYVKTKKDIASDKFKECAHIYTKNDFDREFMDFRRRFPNAAKYLDEKIGLDKWARCHFEGDKYNIDTSNTAESMNNVFVDARKFHLLPMIDVIIEKFSEWFNKHRKDSAGASNTRKLVPVVENELHDHCEIAVRLTVTELNSYHLEYNVIGLDGKTYLVDLKMKSCSCRCFDIDKYPCVHAMAALRNLMRREVRRVHIEMHDLCSIYYLIETWALAYYRTIYVVLHESDWSVPAAIRQLIAKTPEYTKTGGGRTQEKRFSSIAERRRKRRRQMKFKPGINLEKFLQPEDT